MEEGIKFTQEALRLYITADFAHGRDFVPAYQKLQLVKRGASGTPELRGEFVDHMDDTTYDLRIPYERLAAIYNGMYKPEPQTLRDQKMNYLHKTWTWLAFERRNGVTIEKFGDRMGVDEKTVRRWRGQVLDYITTQLTEPQVLKFPSTYTPYAATV